MKYPKQPTELEKSVRVAIETIVLDDLLDNPRVAEFCDSVGDSVVDKQVEALHNKLKYVLLELPAELEAFKDVRDNQNVSADLANALASAIVNGLLKY